MSSEAVSNHNSNDEFIEPASIEEPKWKLSDNPFFADLKDDDVAANPIGFTIHRPKRPHYLPVMMESRKDKLNEPPVQKL